MIGDGGMPSGELTATKVDAIGKRVQRAIDGKRSTGQVEVAVGRIDEQRIGRLQQDCVLTNHTVVSIAREQIGTHDVDNEVPSIVTPLTVLAMMLFRIVGLAFSVT